MSQGYREPPIDKASSRAIVETLCGNSNQTVQSGTWIIHKSRVIGGNMNRFYGLLDHLESIGCDKTRIDKIRVSVAGTTIGFSQKIPEFGMRGEIKEVITQQQLPKKEPVTNTSDGLIRRGKPQTEEPLE